jgi:predicted HicB family RNase H-like nuclease
MPNMLIRNVDERLHAQLVAHAKADSQSLQQYLLARLEAFAAKLTARR